MECFKPYMLFLTSNEEEVNPAECWPTLWYKTEFVNPDNRLVFFSDCLLSRQQTNYQSLYIWTAPTVFPHKAMGTYTTEHWLAPANKEHKALTQTINGCPGMVMDNNGCPEMVMDHNHPWTTVSSLDNLLVLVARIGKYIRMSIRLCFHTLQFNLLPLGVKSHINDFSSWKQRRLPFILKANLPLFFWFWSCQ